MKLTKKQLIEMKPGEIFATGTGTYPELHKEFELRWVACRGKGYCDWCIYYHKLDNSKEYIADNGDKVFTESVIKRLVPCDKEAWKLYRF